MDEVQIQGLRSRYQLMERLPAVRGAHFVGLFSGHCMETGVAVAVKFLRCNENIHQRIEGILTCGATQDAEHVVRLLDSGTLEEENDRFLFIVMEHLSGIDVATHFNQHFRQQQRPMEIRLVINLARQILLGLAELHRHGIVHRDADVSNWFLTDAQTAKLIDLDVSYLPWLQQPEEKRRIGKLHYMPPQQVEMETPSADWDLYAVAIGIYLLTTGTLPFVYGEEEPVIRAIKTKALPRNKLISKDLYKILRKACAKKQSDRFQSADQMIKALGALGHQPSQTTRTALLLLSFLLVLLLLLYRFRSRESSPPPPPPEPRASFDISPVFCTEPCTVTLRSSSEYTTPTTLYRWYINGAELDCRDSVCVTDALKEGNYSFVLIVNNLDITDTASIEFIVTAPPPTPRPNHSRRIKVSGSNQLVTFEDPTFYTNLDSVTATNDPSYIRVAYTRDGQSYECELRVEGGVVTKVETDNCP